MMIRMTMAFFILVGCAVGIPAADVHAKLYFWTDSNGVKHFSTVNVPAEAARQAATSRDPCDDYTNDYNMKFVTIKPGVFLMGSPSSELGRNENSERRHKVTLTKPYQIQVTEVTQKQWKMVMGKNPSFKKGDRLPVQRISWNDAQKFIRKLNLMDPDGHYRLPTEAEWEYACRAGTQTAFSSGPISIEACLPDPNLEAVAWYCGNSDTSPHPVARRLPNAWGLYDMHGNVSEFCQDFFGSYSQWPATDPKGPATGSSIVIRGGSFRYQAVACRSAWRGSYRRDRADGHTGFRLARTIFCEGEADNQPLGVKKSEKRDGQKDR
jgi:formylglycine-generating enzyme required for sulfatase activity